MEQVVMHATRNNLHVSHKGIGEPASHLCRNTKGHMNELTKLRVVGRAANIVVECRNKLLRRPAANNLDLRQVVDFDVHHRRIRRDQFHCGRSGQRINVLRNRQTVAARFGQSDDFLEPRGACCLEVESGIVFCRQSANDRIQ